MYTKIAEQKIEDFTGISKSNNVLKGKPQAKLFNARGLGNAGKVGRHEIAN